jgi:hypothetical protein
MAGSLLQRRREALLQNRSAMLPAVSGRAALRATGHSNVNVSSFQCVLPAIMGGCVSRIWPSKQQLTQAGHHPAGHHRLCHRITCAAVHPGVQLGRTCCRLAVQAGGVSLVPTLVPCILAAGPATRDGQFQGCRGAAQPQVCQSSTCAPSLSNCAPPSEQHGTRGR